MKLKHSLPFLTLILINGCNSTSTTEEPTLTPDLSAEEQAYYDSCATNPDCRAFHVVSSGEEAILSGTLMTENDEKAQRLLNLAEVYIEDFYANAWAEQSKFFPEDYPQDQRATREFPAGKVLGYDDEYLYAMMNFTNYYPKDGALMANGGSGNITYRFKYQTQADGETLEVIDHQETGEAQAEGLPYIFPKEVLAIYYEVQGTQWETPEQTEAVEARAKAFFNL